MNHQNSDDSTYKAISAMLLLAVIILAGMVLYLVVDDKDSATASAPRAADTTSITQPANSKGTSMEVRAATPAPTTATEAKTTCEDVTSIDYNWQNDVFCTRPDGSTFYTDYAGGRRADPIFQR